MLDPGVRGMREAGVNPGPPRNMVVNNRANRSSVQMSPQTFEC